MNPAILILIPLLGAALVLLGGARDELARRTALLAALATVVYAASAWVAYTRDGAALAFSLAEQGIPAFLFLVADGLTLPLLALTAVLGVVAVLASWNVERLRSHMALLLFLEASVMTVFLAADFVLFYVAWEAVLIPMFFLIGGWGHENRRYAAVKFFVYTFAGSALMLVGLVMLIVSSPAGTVMPGPGVISLGALEPLAFWLLALGFLVKVPVVPLHTWLPDAHVEAPTAGSIMLAGVLLKMGAYGFMRVCAVYTPGAFGDAAPVLAALGLLGIVYGAAVALGQRDLKRLVAYSSVAHMGFVMLAIASGTTLGFTGAVLGMVSHGLVAGMLFFLVGALYDRAHTREMAAFGGLGARLPRWSTLFVLASLASLGLPGLSGFPGEFASVVAGFSTFGWPVAVAGLGVVLAGAYGLRAVREVVYGEPDGSAVTAALVDLHPLELAAVAPLVVLTIALGVWPRLVSDVAAGTIQTVIALAGRVS
jgi:NADH-quinone oxidoreductase subunit M